MVDSLSTLNDTKDVSILVPHQTNPITGEPCCSKALNGLKKRKRLPPCIQQHQDGRKAGILIRTGCIPCRLEGVKCDGTNIRCRRQAVSEEWRVNSLDVSASGQGTWRERRGIHVFVKFATSPERAGLFRSDFWHQIVVQACFHNKAVFHVASAVGALYEHIMRRPSTRGVNDDGGMAFALQQCNKSIKLLTSANNEQEVTTVDPGIALITCVLFAVFEALIGRPSQAIVHSLQGRKLLQNCERLAVLGEGSRLVDAASMLPVIGGLEIQAKSIQGKAMVYSDTRDDPPLPDVSRIHSLEHANWTLHNAYIRLLIFCQDTPLDEVPENHATRITEKQQLFGPWLKAWEKSFAGFLFREASSLSKEDMQRARVLKANHIAATMLVDAAQGRPDAWHPYTADCRAIIDLSASVLNSYSVVLGPTLNTFQFPFLSFGLWVVEPLYVVMSRCHDPELRRQAAGLLNGQRAVSNPQNVFRSQERDTYANGVSQSQWDTDAWDTERWIDFARNVRLDAGMATFFGQLPSGYIDKPQYPAISG